MITLLIGHRGVGKTTFLQALGKYAQTQQMACLFFDLDQEIEREAGQSIAQIWSEGEAAFRERERKVLTTLLNRPFSGSKVVALGAGFEGPMPAAADLRVLWLRRETDQDGRIFLNRPRLNPDLPPLVEYQQRRERREERFAQWAHEQLVLPEGYTGGLEAYVLQPQQYQLPYDFTLMPKHFRDWGGFLAQREAWQIRKFELRDDLLSLEQIKLARQTIPADQLLFSLRSPALKLPMADLECDWALELGRPPEGVEVISLHERKKDFLSAVTDLTAHHAEILKLAVEVESFEELEEGHQWWLRDPHRRAFLPRSKEGRWRWYRSLFGPHMPLHFYREDEGSALDQPLFWQTQLQPRLKKHFAAVLGHPVHHSRTPLEHLDFFRSLDMPCVAIDIAEKEFRTAFTFLKKIGLKHAAVTSPLKKVAHLVCDLLTIEAERLEAVNTLTIDRAQVAGHNTDVLALQQIRQTIFTQAQEVWLWGGGGVKSSVRAVWPKLKEISARQGTSEAGQPDLLIWAAGRSHDFQWPQDRVKPKQILDLNYGDNSPGLEWALLRNLPYQSGLKMFKLQADFQRHFWRG